MKIVWEMYGNAYKSVCLKFFPEEPCARLLCGTGDSGGTMRLWCGTARGNGGGGVACDYGAERGRRRIVRLRDGTEGGDGDGAITVRTGRAVVGCAITGRNGGW